MKQKKASIITFHCVPNYGAVLQTFGMVTYLRKHFDEVEVIDYRPETLCKDYKAINFYSIPSVVMSLWSLRPYLKKVRKFKTFEKKYLYLSENGGKTAEEIGEVNTDLVVLGSDQVWNAQITKGIDPVYFGRLNWAEKKPTVISYAASIGKGNLTEQERNEIIRLLKNLDAVSVRESDAQKLVENLTDKEVQVVVDPTVLAGAEAFTPLIRPVPYQNYLLFYSLNGYEETEAMAEKIARYQNLQLVELSGRRKGLFHKNHITLHDAGPEEFVSLIAGASYVVTDSFHGTVFSLLYHRPFVTIPHKTRGGRIKTLLSLCDLEQRCTPVFSRDLLEDGIDWNDVEQKLQKARECSEQFIRRAVVCCDKCI